MTTSLKFLSGGGEMGALIRTHNWESSPLGPADKWPQSLRTTLSILLNSKFPMFLYWGPQLLCFYNDAYRFSLGNDGKHPLILGMKGEEAWKETWHMLKPFIDQVFNNDEATWSEDQLIPIYREGGMKDAYWSFSFSAVKDELDLTAGVFLTLIETTEKVSNLKNLLETNDQLAFAIEATELGTFDLNPVTNKFIANNRLKQWFGLPHEMEVDLLLATDVIVEKDRARVVTAIEKALQYQSGGLYDIEFSIVNPVTKEEKVVRAKGRAWFGDDENAYRFNGTLQDITIQANDRSKIEASEKRLEVERKSLHDFFIQAPAALAILKGREHVFEFVNPVYIELIGGRNPTGKTLLEGLPEIAGQGFMELLDKVYKTGEAFIGKEMPISVNKGNGNLEQLHLNFTYQAFKNDVGETEGILVFAYDVTEQVSSRKLMEASEKRFSNILSQSIMAIAILKGPEMTVTFANESIIAIWGKGPDVFGKPLVEVLPEIKDQVFPQLLNDVYTTGVPFVNSEISCMLNRNGKMEEYFFNLLYQPYRDVDNSISGITILATEVTEQVRAKKQIEESEKRISNILSQSIMSIGILKGSDMIVALVNEPLLKIWGKTQDIVGKPLFEVMPELAAQGFPKQLNDVFTTGIPHTFHENRAFLINNGIPEERFFSVVIQPYTEVDNTITGVTVIGTEVTDYVQAKKQIEQNEAEQKKLASQLKLATDSANIGVWSLDVASSKLDWSDTHKLMWGYNEHFEDLNYDHWHKAIVPEDKVVAFQKIEESRINRSVYDVEYRIHKVDDHLMRSIRSVGRYYYNDNGEAETLTGISIDMTEQKQAQEKITESEKQFRIFADKIQNLAWIANVDGWIYFYNQQWYDYTGTTLNEMEGTGWQKVHHPDKVEQVSEFLKDAWKKDEPFELTCRLRSADGEYRWFLTRGYPVKDTYGNIERWIGTNTDIHDQKEKEEQKDDFISIASHEMKTPLTSAKGYLELLLMILEENQTAFLYANKATGAVNRLNSLVTELLDVSKIQNGKLDYNLSIFNFNEMVDEAIENIQVSAKDHSLQKTGNIVQQIKGDKERLQQVMINLLTNAIKYSPSGEKVFINVEEKEGTIQVSVQDFGVGMASQHLDKVFSRYYRVQEHAVHFKGLGIGLYISSNIIQRHEGKIWVESEPGKGSTFYFTIPLLTH